MCFLNIITISWVSGGLQVIILSIMLSWFNIRQKRHTLSAVMSSASTHEIKLVTDVMDNVIVKRSSPPTKCNSSRKRRLQYLCINKAYNSRTVKQAMIKRGNFPHIPYKRSRG